MATPPDGDRYEHDASRRFFMWRHKHPLEAEDPALVWAAAWRAGAWDAIRSNFTLGLNLSQVIERLEELYALYADVEVERRAEREMGEASNYWRTWRT
jgi:hypothetical protein